MPNDLDHIRAAFEYHIALYGSRVWASDESIGATPSEPEARIPAPLSDEPKSATPSEPSSPVVPSAYARISELIPPGSPLHEMDSLAEVATYAARSPLNDASSAHFKPVFGTGNQKADLLVIGVAPSEAEEEAGEPLVGKAGQLFTKILEAIGFARTDVYLTHIIKSRVPADSEALPTEITAHIPILLKQIALIQPTIILCLGEKTGLSLLGLASNETDLRGIVHDYHGIPVWVTYHPEDLLQDATLKRPTWEDVQRLRTRYDELTSTEN